MGSRVTSTYVDVYSDTLYQLLLRNNAQAKDLRKQIRKIEKALALLVIPEEKVSAFKKLLVAYYEGEDIGKIKAFLKQHCHKHFR